jgi:hypothetical protein
MQTFVCMCMSLKAGLPEREQAIKHTQRPGIMSNVYRVKRATLSSKTTRGHGIPWRTAARVGSNRSGTTFYYPLVCIIAWE